MSTKQSPEQPTTIAEQLVTALTRVWRTIQARHPEVPEVVLTIGSGTTNPRATKYGHFAAARWQRDEDSLAELFVSGEGLRRGSAEVLTTLLHEAAHGLAFARGISDTSREGKYHNKRFKVLAEELGLVIEHDPRIGFSPSTLPPSTAESYAAELDTLGEAITAWRHAEVHVPKPKRTDHNNVVAQCECPRRIRVARRVLAEAPIVCGACDREFVTEDVGDEGQD
jgi:hypothetical protein